MCRFVYMIIKSDPDILKGYLEDSSNLQGGHAERVVVPQDERELASFLKEADAARTPVTVSGGGTGTTGSRIPFGGVVLSLEKFGRIVGLSEADRAVTLEPCVFVDDVRKACEAKGLFYACHPTESTATVGGTVATNASGARSFRYGPTRRHVRRLRMVLPGGEVLDLRRGEVFLRGRAPKVVLPGGRAVVVPMPSYRMPDVKNAAGYYARDGMDLIDLFIGQEGTLSVITEIEIGLVPKPEKILSAFAFFASEEAAWAFAAEARRLSGRGDRPSGIIDALSIEYFDNNALDFLRAKSANVPAAARAAIFFEEEMTGGSEERVVNAWLDLIARHGADPDQTWVAMTEKEAEALAGYRYSIPDSVNDIIRRTGLQKMSTDIAVPEAQFDEMVRFYGETLRAAGLAHVIFGHIGECHLHVNILPRSTAEVEQGRAAILEFVRTGVRLGGTVSAEHGIGKIKHRYLEEMYGKEGIAEMARIKKAFDPNCILGLDTMFSREVLKTV